MSLRHHVSTFSIPLLSLMLGCSQPQNDELSIKTTDQSITLLSAEKPILVYNIAAPSLPEGMDPIYSRNGFIHPVFTPGGTPITQSFGQSHPHQTGVFMAWTKTQFRGENVDFWNIHKGLGRVAHSRILSTSKSGDNVSFEVQLAHQARVGETHQTVLDETIEVTAYTKQDDLFIFDLSSSQSLTADQELLLNEYHYGGMALRLTDQWYGEDNDQVTFTTSDGKDRIQGNHTRQRWVAASGLIDGEPATIAVLGHPSNFRAPQPVRIHNKIPYFSFSPMVLGEFSISPGEKYDSRYRYLVSSTKLDTAQIESHWERFANE